MDDQIEQMYKNNSYITVKDHKEDFLSKIVMKNWATWDRFEPRTKNRKSKIQKKNYFCFLNFVLGLNLS